MSLVQLSKLLELPESDLQQVLDYASSLPKAEAAEHFKNLLGDSPGAIEFIASFNSRRADPSEIDAVPKHQRQPKKKKAPLHTPAPRQVTAVGPAPGASYSKKAQGDEYIPRRSGSSTPANDSGFQTPPPAPLQAPKATVVSRPRQGVSPSHVTRTPSPAKQAAPKSDRKAKVAIAGGTPMHGASTALDDLDAAIRSLEITTNPALSGGPANDASRRCNCVATRHPLQTAAPNCLKCGKVICVKEGLGPCTFCGTPLLSSSEVQSMIKELRAERGRERMAVDRAAHRKADVASTPRPFTKPRGDADLSAAEAKAREHRDKLLGFQAQNAQRTTVRDEAADFDVTVAMGSGAGSAWATPEDRARELKRQQKLLREMEWNARPDYEKRQQVLSIDLVGGKVVKKMVARDRPPSPDAVSGPTTSVAALSETDGNKGSGTAGAGVFSRNPLLAGGMIKPVYDTSGQDSQLEGRQSAPSRWRRVQDDMADNEDVILDGGIHGGESHGPGPSASDEPVCG